MKISERWLRQWVNPEVDSETLAEQLTMLGLEVDEISNVARAFHGVIVGEVLTVDPHPDADRLRVTTVNVGQAENLQIVCGAPNVRQGMKVAVATIGAMLPGAFEIKASKLRGVDSQGMLCGASELDLVDEIDGLMELADDAPIGADIRQYLDLDDQVIDISLTPNRGDCFSIRGLAREIAVQNQLGLTQAPINAVTATIKDQLQVQLQDQGSARYAGRIIRNVNFQAPTPLWLKQLLQRCGVRPHNIIVDLTNYVMLELGQPMHAFDLAKIDGDIVVRLASENEKLKLLNEQEITLGTEHLVIADQSKVLALAGIMGGLDCSVTAQTQDVFLESAFFLPLSIAGRARGFGLHTDASLRYERGVDFELPIPALERLTQLILQYAGGAAGPITLAEQTESLPSRPEIELTAAELQQLIGQKIEPGFVTQSLSGLGCEVRHHAEANYWQVIPPSHRFDLAISQDLVEEVVRLYGYDAIEIRRPKIEILMSAHQDRLEMDQLRQHIAAIDYQEAISFSFVDSKIEKQLNPDVQSLALANPLSNDLAVMRSSLLSSLIPCVQYNINRQQQRVRLFESGLRFDYQQATSIADLKQIPTLALIAVDSQFPEQWAASSQAVDFYDFKADVVAIFSAARLKPSFERSDRAWLHPGQSAEIIINKQKVGYLGRLHPALESQFDLSTTWVCEIDQEVLLQPYVSNFTELSRFPSVRRDIAILIDDNINVEQIQQAIQSSANEYLERCWLFDVYTGEGVADGQRSLAFALQWQHPDRTLEDAEIKQGMQTVIDTLQNRYGATLRAS